MNHRDFKAWCKAATAKIRYGPDREAVAAELLGHMEDKYDAMVASGMTEEEAIQKTIESMGSSVEIAPQLGKIHRPWLGYLYSATLGVALMLWLGLLCVGVNLLPYGLASILIPPESDMTVDAQSAAYIRQQDAAVFVDGYYVQVVETIRVPEEALLYIKTKTTKVDRFDLTVLSHMWGVDDLGNLYASGNTREWQTRQIRFWEEYASGNVRYTHWRVTDLDPHAKWLELHYDRDGRDIVLRLDLTGGVIYESP